MSGLRRRNLREYRYHSWGRRCDVYRHGSIDFNGVDVIKIAMSHGPVGVVERVVVVDTRGGGRGHVVTRVVSLILLILLLLLIVVKW